MHMTTLSLGRMKRSMRASSSIWFKTNQIWTQARAKQPTSLPSPRKQTLNRSSTDTVTTVRSGMSSGLSSCWVWIWLSSMMTTMWMSCTFRAQMLWTRNLRSWRRTISSIYTGYRMLSSIWRWRSGIMIGRMSEWKRRWMRCWRTSRTWWIRLRRHRRIWRHLKSRVLGRWSRIRTLCCRRI